MRTPHPRHWFVRNKGRKFRVMGVMKNLRIAGASALFVLALSPVALAQRDAGTNYDDVIHHRVGCG